MRFRVLFAAILLLACAEEEVGEPQISCFRHSHCPLGMYCGSNLCRSPRPSTGGGTTVPRPDTGSPVLPPADAGQSNQPPVITSNPLLTATENTLYQYQILATDPEGQVLSFALLSGPAGATVDGASGLLTWTPTAEQSGQGQDFQVEVQDEAAAAVRQNWTVQVAASQVPVLNRAPSITSSPVTQAEVGVEYRYPATATDPDDDSLTWELPLSTNPPLGMTVDSDSGEVTWTPAQNQDDISARVTLSVSDGELSDSQVFEVGVGRPASNHAPVFTSTPPSQATADELLNYAATATDQDGDTLSFDFTDVANCPFSVESDTGAVTWTPTVAQIGSTETCTLNVTDPGGLADAQLISLTVIAAAPSNSAPSISSTPGTTAVVGQAYGYTATATDSDGDSLTWSLPTGSPGATLAAETGVLQWTPTIEEGDESIDFTIVVTDGQGGEDRQSWVVAVAAEAPVNSPPVITSSAPTTASQGQVYTYGAQATDGDGDSLTWSLVTGSPVALLDSQTGVLQWTPTAGEAGRTLDFTIEVSDGQASVQQSWQVIVAQAPANNPPTISSNPVESAVALQPYAYEVIASDPDNDVLSFSLVAGSPLAAFNGLNRNRLDWTPSAAEGDQTIPFTVEVSDGRGGTDTQTWQVAVAAAASPNSAPVIVSTPSESGTALAEYRYDGLATDADNDPLTWVLVTGPQTAILNADTGALRWTPSAEEGGQSHNFHLNVSDGRGGTDQQIWSVAVAPVPVQNTAPTITSQASQSATEGQLYRYDAVATDPDNDNLTWTLTAGPGTALLDASSGILLWTPNIQDDGAFVIFAIEVSDGLGGVDSQNWTVSVDVAAPGNRSPQIVTTPGEAARRERTYRYLAAAEDPDNDPLTWVLISGPLGAVIEAETGQVLWTSTRNDEVGDYDFRIVVSDGQGGTDQQNWTVTLTAPQPPGFGNFNVPGFEEVGENDAGP